jgi:putative aldouronate transport system permease protein
MFGELEKTTKPILYVKKKKTLIRKIKENYQLLIMMIPGTIFVILFNYMPFYGLSIAFRTTDFSRGVFGGDFVGLKNFGFIFASKDAALIIRNTVGYNLVFIIMNVVFGIGFAVILNELKNRKLAKLYQNVTFIPFFLSMVIVSYIGYAFLSESAGFINTAILKPLGFKPAMFYTDPKYWYFIIPIVHMWKVVGSNVVVYLAAMASIDQEMFEAAVIDGASKWKQFIKITLPSIAPQITIMTILALSGIFRSDFGLFYQVPMGGGPIQDAVNTLDVYVYRSLVQTMNFGMSGAVGLFQSGVGLILIIMSNKVIKKFDESQKIF